MYMKEKKQNKGQVFLRKISHDSKEDRTYNICGWDHTVKRSANCSPNGQST